VLWALPARRGKLPYLGSRRVTTSIRPVRAELRPVFVIGCGAIVRDAHLPAYALDGIPGGAFFDIGGTRAALLAEATKGTTAFTTLDKLFDALFDACSAARGEMISEEPLPA